MFTIILKVVVCFLGTIIQSLPVFLTLIINRYAGKLLMYRFDIVIFKNLFKKLFKAFC